MPAFKTVLEEHIAGDPMKPDYLWTNLSLQAISRLMSAAGFYASPYTVEQLLHECKLGHRQAFKYRPGSIPGDKFGPRMAPVGIS